MHDIEIPRLESELDEYEAAYAGEDEDESADEQQSEGESEDEDETAALSERQVQEYAAELLSVQNEQELDYFLSDLIQAAGKAISSPLGKQIGGMLKGVAKRALPIAGGILGNLALPGVGGVIGSKLGSAAASVFELQLEGMSSEDEEYEVAKQFVRLAADASKRAGKAGRQRQAGASPAQQARKSMTEAAHKFAPGLLKAAHQGALPEEPSAGEPGGRWVRRGDRIVLFGV